jgi:hypothetical protein
MEDPKPGRALDCVGEQRRLADPGLTTHDEDSAPTCTRGLEHTIYFPALIPTPPQHAAPPRSEQSGKP